MFHRAERSERMPSEDEVRLYGRLDCVELSARSYFFILVKLVSVALASPPSGLTLYAVIIK